MGFGQRVDGAARLSGLLIGTEIADAIDRYGPRRSLRLIGAGSLGRLYEAALSERGFDVIAVDADEASRLGLRNAAIHIWGGPFCHYPRGSVAQGPVLAHCQSARSPSRS